MRPVREDPCEDASRCSSRPCSCSPCCPVPRRPPDPGRTPQAQSRADGAGLLDARADRVGEADRVRRAGPSPKAKPGGGGGSVQHDGASWPTSDTDPITRDHRQGAVLDGRRQLGVLGVGRRRRPQRHERDFSVVLTAGHCVVDADTGEFATNWLFVPGLRPDPDVHLRQHAARLLDRGRARGAHRVRQRRRLQRRGGPARLGASRSSGRRQDGRRQPRARHHGRRRRSALADAVRAWRDDDRARLPGRRQVPRQRPRLLPGHVGTDPRSTNTDLLDAVRHDRRQLRRPVGGRTRARATAPAAGRSTRTATRRSGTMYGPIFNAETSATLDGGQQRHERATCSSGRSHSRTCAPRRPAATPASSIPGRASRACRTMGACPPTRRRPTRASSPGSIAAAVTLVLVVAGSDPTIDVKEPFAGWVTAQDARSYYGLNLADLYAGRTEWNTIGAYPYSPAFAQLVYPLNLLPWPLFVAAWTADPDRRRVACSPGRELFLLGLVVGGDGDRGRQHQPAAHGRDRARVPVAARPGRSCC